LGEEGGIIVNRLKLEFDCLTNVFEGLIFGATLADASARILLLVGFFKVLRDEYLDQGLAGDAEPFGFPVQRMNHPEGEIYIDPLLLLRRTACLRQVQILCDLFS